MTALLIAVDVDGKVRILGGEATRLKGLTPAVPDRKRR
jgi:hypothetical protein